MTLGAGFPGRWRRQLAHAERKVGNQPCQLTPAHSKVRAQLVGGDDALEVLQCRHEWRVRHGHGGITRAVQDERAVGRRLVCELPNQPALSGSRLTDQYGDATALISRVAQHRAQQRLLARASNEWEGRRWAEWPGEWRQVRHGDSQI